MLTDDQREALIQAARRHMTTNALGMQRQLDPIDVAGVFIGAGVGVLLNAFGPQQTIDYLLNVAAGLDQQGGGKLPEKN